MKNNDPLANQDEYDSIPLCRWCGEPTFDMDYCQECGKKVKIDRRPEQEKDCIEAMNRGYGRRLNEGLRLLGAWKDER